MVRYVEIFLTRERKDRLYTTTWKIEGVSYWGWTWAEPYGLLGDGSFETIWRIGPLHITRRTQSFAADD